jgi:hypothetical protein
MKRTSDIEQAVLAAGHRAGFIPVGEKCQTDRQAAKRELDMHQANLARLQSPGNKAAGRLHTHPLGNMSAQDLLR